MAKSRRSATTIYLDPKLARAIKVKAALNDKSVSDLANEAFSRFLSEDAADSALVRKRRREKSRSYEEVLAELKRDGLI